MRHLLLVRVFLLMSLFMTSIVVKAQDTGMFHENQRWIYEISSMDFLVFGCRKSCFNEDYWIIGSKQMNGKTYWQLKIYRDKYDGNCGDIPDSCYYLYSYPNPIYNPVQVGIREENGRWLVDKDEYMSLISDACWWKYVGDVGFIPYEDTGDGELVLYDFTKQVGDVYGAAEGHDPIMVDGVDYIETDDGVSRRMLTLSNGYQIVEGIGCINSPGLLLFYLNPRKTLLDYAILSGFGDDSIWVFSQSFKEMAETAVAEYELKSVQLDCPDGNHPHAIDLGLPSGLKWACCNIGAESPQEKGSLFAWGETEEKEIFDLNNYRFHTTGYNFDYSETNGIISGTRYDAACSKWGGLWRTATVEETEELIGCCSHEIVRNRLADGLKLKGPSGRSILLPFTYTSDLKVGIYWTGNLYPFVGWSTYANTMFITDDPMKYIYISHPYSGRAVRPLYDETLHINDIIKEEKQSQKDIFNAYGIKIGDGSDKNLNLPKGLYIIHGKKTVVR